MRGGVERLTLDVTRTLICGEKGADPEGCPVPSVSNQEPGRTSNKEGESGRWYLLWSPESSGIGSRARQPGCGSSSASGNKHYRRGGRWRQPGALSAPPHGPAPARAPVAYGGAVLNRPGRGPAARCFRSSAIRAPIRTQTRTYAAPRFPLHHACRPSIRPATYGHVAPQNLPPDGSRSLGSQLTGPRRTPDRFAKGWRESIARWPDQHHGSK
jgi:hypothetical protein